MSLFGGVPIPWRRQSTALAAAASPAPASPPMTEQGQPDDLRGRRWRGRSQTTRGLAVDVTPQRIGAALRSADAGEPGDLYSLLQDITDRDPEVVTCLGVRKDAVALCPYEVKPRGKSPTDQDYRVAEACQQMLDDLPGLEVGLKDLLGSIETGFAATEIDWQFDGLMWRPGALLYRPPRHFKPDPSDPGRWRLLSADNLIDGEELWPNKWVCHRARAKPGYDTQAGLGRVLLWFWLLSHYALKDWSAYGEMFGSPFRKGEYPPTALPEQIDALADALEQIGTDGWGAFPEGFKVDFIGDSSFRSGPDVYLKMIEHCNKAKAKTILGQTLTTDAGDKGARALGQVHNEVRQNIRDSDAKQLAATLTRDLLRPFVLFNFGPTVPVPQMRFLTEPPKDRLKEAQAQGSRADVFAKAVAMGLEVSEAQAREELGLREIQAGEPLLKRPASPPGQPPPEDEGEEE